MRTLFLVAAAGLVLGGCQSSTKIEGARSDAKRETLTQRLSIKSADQKPESQSVVRFRVVTPK
jgi:outer membrane murein-binding lipoprotein Lpp